MMTTIALFVVKNYNSTVAYNTKIYRVSDLILNKERMKPKEKTMLEFAGYCFIHKPELANDLNTLIAGFLNKPKKSVSGQTT